MTLTTIDGYIGLGLHLNVERSLYEKVDAINYSTLKHFERSPAHAREEMLHPPMPTDAMELGTATHMAVLEPQRFLENYVCAPQVDRRTKEGKASWAAFENEHPGRSYLSPVEWEQCRGMLNAVQAYDVARQLLFSPDGKNEVTAVWKDGDTDLLCKGRFDRFTNFVGESVVVDVKTTADAREWQFASQMARMQYHLQAAFYLDGLHTLLPIERRYLFLVIERDAPFGIQIFELEDSAIAEGRRCYKAYLKTYQQCKETGIWPGYPEGITPIRLPKWATKGGDFYE